MLLRPNKAVFDCKHETFCADHSIFEIIHRKTFHGPYHPCRDKRFRKCPSGCERRHPIRLVRRQLNHKEQDSASPWFAQGKYDAYFLKTATGVNKTINFFYVKIPSTTFTASNLSWRIRKTTSIFSAVGVVHLTSRY